MNLLKKQKKKQRKNTWSGMGKLWGQGPRPIIGRKCFQHYWHRAKPEQMSQGFQNSGRLRIQKGVFPIKLKFEDNNLIVCTSNRAPLRNLIRTCSMFEIKPSVFFSDESTRPLQRQRPRLQDIRLKSYFHSVDTESCNSCDGVRVYYVQEPTA